MPTDPPADNDTYDVFISYSHADSDWVWEWLVPRLKDAGLRVCTDRESFAIGVPALINMENAVAASRHTLLVLTPAYVQSQWALFEQILTQTQDPIGLRQRTLPVLRQPCDLPPRIAMLTYVDMQKDADAERQFTRLLKAIQGGRSLPPPRSVLVGDLAQPAVASQPQPTAKFNTAAVRELLLAAFSDEELTTFCFDYYRLVYENFAAGMSRPQKVQILMEHCERRGGMAALLGRVKDANPYQYQRYGARLGKSDSTS